MSIYIFMSEDSKSFTNQKGTTNLGYNVAATSMMIIYVKGSCGLYCYRPFIPP